MSQLALILRLEEVEGGYGMPPSNYQLYPTAQAQPRFQNSPKGNAKLDGEAAINTLTCVTKKWIRVETGGLDYGSSTLTA